MNNVKKFFLLTMVLFVSTSTIANGTIKSHDKIITSTPRVVTVNHGILLSTSDSKVSQEENHVVKEQAPRKLSNGDIDQSTPERERDAVFKSTGLKSWSSDLDQKSGAKPFTRISPASSYSQATPHEAIGILSDGELKNASQGGSGTSSDPYIFEHLNIKGNSTHLPFSIQNTRKYFTLRYSILQQANLSNPSASGGIDLNSAAILINNVSNANISANLIQNNVFYGIRIYNSENIFITLNDFAWNSKASIVIENSKNILISSNVFNNTGDGAIPDPGVRMYTVHSQFSNNIYIQGNYFRKTNAHGDVYLYYTDDSDISSNTFDGAIMSTAVGGKASIYVDVNSDNNTISYNTFQNNLYDGINVDGVTNGETRIFNNTIENIQGNGLQVLSSDKVVVQGNTFSNNDFTGMRVQFYSRNITIAENTFYRNGGSGLSVEGYQSFPEDLGMNITRNNFVANGQRGLELISVDNLAVAFNFIERNNGSGLFLDEVNATRIFNNTITDNKNHGIEATSSNFWNKAGGVLVENNNISANTNDGINHGNSGVFNYTYENNILVHNNRGIYVRYSDGNLFIGNQVHNNTKAGLEIYFSENNTIIKNNIRYNGEDGVILDTYAKRNRLEENVILQNNKSGILIWYYSHYNEFIRNNISKNTENGVTFKNDAENNTLKLNDISMNGKLGILMKNSTASVINNTINDNQEGGLLVNKTIPVHVETSFSLTDLETTALIVNNSVNTNVNVGIAVVKSQYIMVRGNTITFTVNGDNIDVEDSKNVIIFDNIIIGLGPADSIFSLETYYAIYSNGSNGLEVYNNTIFNHTASGIYIIESNFTSIEGNDIFKNGYGVLNEKSNYTTLWRNKIHEHDNLPNVKLVSSKNAIVSENSIYNGGKEGILMKNGVTSLIESNTFLFNALYAITIDITSKDNNITNNGFLTNNAKLKGSGPPKSQVLDNGTNTLITKNYWNEWTVPDTNDDGYVDNPYVINGTAKNRDPLPLADLPTLPVVHYLAGALVLTPNGGEVLNGVVNVTWTPATDSASHAITYSVYYSPDNGTTWTMLENGLTTTFYLWNTTTLAEGSLYLIKVRADDGFSMTVEDISDDVFAIKNGSVPSSNTTTTTTSTDPTSTTPVSSPSSTASQASVSSTVPSFAAVHALLALSSLGIIFSLRRVRKV